MALTRHLTHSRALVLLLLPILAGCSGGNKPSPSSGAAPPSGASLTASGTPSFRETLSRDRLALNADSTKEQRRALLDRTLDCSTAAERTPGDRYACMAAWLDAGLQADQAPEGIQRRMAQSVYRSLDERAPGATGGEDRVAGALAASLLKRFDLARFLDAGARSRLKELFQELAPEDDLFRARAKLRGEARQLLETEGAR